MRHIAEVLADVIGVGAAKLAIGISSCLLGDAVRADGSHAFEPLIAGVFGLEADWVKVCPEWEMGLGVPREGLRLERDGDLVQVVSAVSREDFSGRMDTWIERRMEQLQVERLDAFLLKSGSPTCGTVAPVFDGQGAALDEQRRGWFADLIAKRYPLLPAVDEVALREPLGMTSFVEQVYAVRRMRKMFAGEWRAEDVAAFHQRHKLLLQARTPEAYEELFVTAVTAPARPREEVRAEYAERFAAAMARPATVDGHTAVLQKVLSPMVPAMMSREYDRLGRETELFRRGRAPLEDIRRELADTASMYRAAGVQDQYYLYPETAEGLTRRAAEAVLAAV